MSSTSKGDGIDGSARRGVKLCGPSRGFGFASSSLHAATLPPSTCLLRLLSQARTLGSNLQHAASSSLGSVS
jgi:hypothetical protein